MHSLLSFILSHGYHAVIRGDTSQPTIVVFIPFTHPAGNGFDAVNVRTLAEARAAMGY